MTKIGEAAVELWTLLHNGRRPDCRWDAESQRYYEHVVTLFITSEPVRHLMELSGND